MSGFHEVRFPAALSMGSSGGPERRTRVVTLASGFEKRNAAWAHGRRRYDAGVGLRGLDDLHEVIAFFEARMGRLHGFRWRDWMDWKSCAPSRAPSAIDCEIGTGDGDNRRFQLRKPYISGPAAYVRLISKPIVETVLIGVDGVAAEAQVDPTNGVVTLAAPPAPGTRVTAGFCFDVPARFDSDRIEINLAAFEAGEIPSIPVVEIRV